MIDSYDSLLIYLRYSNEQEVSSMDIGRVAFAGQMPQLRQLREIRERQFLTQKELADRSGVSRVTIARLEGAGEDARFSTVKKLAAALGVEPQELVGNE